MRPPVIRRGAGDILAAATGSTGIGIEDEDEDEDENQPTNHPVAFDKA